MADKHPYSPSGGGAVVKAITQLRKSFPGTVNADTLTKLGIAPNGESYVINILRYIGLIDEKGAKTSKGAATLAKHEEAEFRKAFSDLVKVAYKDLFELHGDAAWGLDSDKLISFFRATDETSDIVGKRQAQAFRALASLSGHGEPVKPIVTKPEGSKKVEKPVPKKTAQTDGKKAAPTPPAATPEAIEHPGVGLTVRIEINLPASGDQETYDRIFKSIRENLLRG
jgi:Family of unknown function (DUF5343)